uniref:Uncharacterized protein n=1 Tax=Ananas comosus var. bracteatus TaxID=296719 RepID=A0A6V7P319_ANACO|nr:unnamed protein product [Ananas comosus var. bracteatus]
MYYIENPNDRSELLRVLLVAVVSIPLPLPPPPPVPPLLRLLSGGGGGASYADAVHGAVPGGSRRIPPDKALYAASRSLSGLSSPARPDAVVSFLRGSASLSPPQILRFVRCRPSILAADVPSNLLPKLSLFRSLLPGAGDGAAEAPGVLADLVTACASAFGYSAARLARSLAFLRDLYGGDDCGVVFALRRCPRLLSNDPDRVLSRNLAAVRDLYGGGRDPLPLIKKAPVLLTSSRSASRSFSAPPRR